MSFGFGKALDVMRDGDAVRRAGWGDVDFGVIGLSTAPKITLWPATQPEEDHIVMAQFMIVITLADGRTRFQAWPPSHDDLLAEDWDYARG
jgi:hypothetical protein